MSLSTGRTPESAGAIEENLLRYLESRTTTRWVPDRDLFNTGGLLSVAHKADDIDFAIEAFERSVLRMRLEGLVP